jgi:anti-anti-sigma factor
MLKVGVEDLGDAVVLHCQGRLVRGEETALLCAAARRHAQNIILDLREVETIDAAGIGALIALQAAGIYLKLINPSRHTREILRVTKLQSFFEICESEPLEAPAMKALHPVTPVHAEAEPVVA